MPTKEAQIERIYQYLYKNVTMSKYVTAQHFQTHTKGTHIAYETVLRRLRELREETSIVENTGIDIRRKVYKVDDEFYSIEKPQIYIKIEFDRTGQGTIFNEVRNT